MSTDELGYFPDLKKFIIFITRYYILLISLVLFFLILGFYKFNQDKNNPIINEKFHIEVTKKPNINYEFIKEKYQNTSQVKTLSNYIDIHQHVFNQINEWIKNNLKLKNANFTYSADNNKKSIFVISDLEITNEYSKEINDNILNSFDNYIQNYKIIEYSKLERKITQFLFDITVDEGFPSVLITDNFNSGNDENKLKFLEDTFNQLVERGITQVPESIFGDLFLQDNEYKEKFVETIKLHLLEKCKITNYEDFFCNYIKLNKLEYNDNDNYQKRICELASSSMDFKRVLLIILDSKTLCSEGFILSEDIIFKPLYIYLEKINFYDGLFEIKVFSTSKQITPSLLVYLLYSVIFAFFVFLILSIIHSFFRNS